MADDSFVCFMFYGLNYQIGNNCVASDEIVLAVLETEILISLGMPYVFFN
jgi:hypothetical protein